MPFSPVELIISAKIEDRPPGSFSFPSKTAAARHLRRILSRGPQELSSSRMPSQLEGAMGALITVFYNYSGNDGDKHKLNKGELKELLHSELTDFLTSQKDPMLVEKIMNDLDSNKDNEVDFNEFVVLVAALTVACNDFFQEQNKNAK
ncbi:protein S100-Z [Poeciliopsis prolifica]|uniref:protein S100-Z n=1 Tax=Poeciliopsis prolifica TaxID=188132 RepID=UPI00241323EC|nr:protein S100-Z [Poeciliopsis prolifica]